MREDWKIVRERQRRALETMTRPRESAKVLERRRATVAALRGTLERRHVATLPFEMRESAQDGKLRFRGYAALFDDRTEIGDVARNGFYEIVRPGAFKRCLAQPAFDTVLNLGHGENGSGLPIARVSAGTLRLREDSTGLAVEADLDPSDPDVELLAIKLRNGNLDGQMSYAFRCGRDRFDEETRTRELLEVSIAKGDVSIVTYGANPRTTSSLRSRSRRPLSGEDLRGEDLVRRARAMRARQQERVRALQKRKVR